MNPVFWSCIMQVAIMYLIVYIASCWSTIKQMAAIIIFKTLLYFAGTNSTSNLWMKPTCTRGSRCDSNRIVIAFLIRSEYCVFYWDMIGVWLIDVERISKVFSKFQNNFKFRINLALKLNIGEPKVCNQRLLSLIKVEGVRHEWNTFYLFWSCDRL